VAGETEAYSAAEMAAIRLLEPGTVINPTETTVADARAAVARRPRDADLWHALGEALLVAGDVSEAVEAYRKATRLPPKVIGRAYLHRDLAAALERAGDLAGAVAAARVAVRTWPVSQQGLFCNGTEERLLTRLLVKTHDAKGALAFYRPLFEADRDREECREIHQALVTASG
jgi:tetratricopeptide (TPR) repeat protein